MMPMVIKLRKTVSNGTQQDYLGGIEYTNGAIDAVYHEEGRATPTLTGWQYEYYLKDHLGNTRVIFSDTNNDDIPEILQEADYYPFGMRHDRSTTAANHYLYNGKELNEDLGLDWYDYGARWLDVETGRWSSIDPLAESYASMSPFNYVANNPIRNIDPDGRRIEPIITKGGGKSGRDLLTIKITGKIIDFSKDNGIFDKPVSPQKILDNLKPYIERILQKEDIDGYDVNVDFDFTVAKSMSEVSQNDHLIVLAEQKKKIKLNGQKIDKVYGAANIYGGKVLTVDEDYYTGVFDANSTLGLRTIVHEFVHLLNLGHSKGNEYFNLMRGGSLPRIVSANHTNLSDRQWRVIINNLLKYPSNINKGKTKEMGYPVLGAAKVGFYLDPNKVKQKAPYEYK